jgi:hypothetical protein
VIRLVERLRVVNIFLNLLVQEVKLKSNRYTIKSNRVQVSAKYIIITMSPLIVGWISYNLLLLMG